MSTAPNRRASRSRSDAELLDAWRAGDTTSGDELFLRYFYTVSRFYRNKIAADRVADLIQETFVVCVEGRDRILDGGCFRAYLLSVAYRVLCRHLRARYRESSEVEIEVDLEVHAVEDIDASPTSVIVRAQEQRLLLEALRAIPTNYQVVLELHYWESLGTREIATVLALPSGTVRSRLQRARDALEAALARLARSDEILDSTLTQLDDWAERCGRELG